MVPSVQVKSPLTSIVSDPVSVPALPLGRLRLAAVIVAPVLKFTTPDSIVTLPSGPAVLPAGEDDAGAGSALGGDQGLAARVVRAAGGEIG